jgi:hypothetical protein
MEKAKENARRAAVLRGYSLEADHYPGRPDLRILRAATGPWMCAPASGCRKA